MTIQISIEDIQETRNHRIIEQWHQEEKQTNQKKVREKSRECHNHKPQSFLDTKRKRKQTKPNKCKSNKHTKSTKISSLFPKRGSRSTKRTEKHKNKITQGKSDRTQARQKERPSNHLPLLLQGDHKIINSIHSMQK